MTNIRHFRYALLAFVAVFALQIVAQTTNSKWREMHKVKKKETIFGIAREYGITIDELIKANPEMSTPGYELKKGDFIFIPYPANSKEAKAASAAAKTQTAAATTQDDVRKRAIRVGVMLPLHDVDGDGRRMVEYYRGMLLAIDSLKQNGISVDVHAWNVPIDADIRQTLLEKEASRCDIIFGPLYTKQMKPLSDFVRTYGIKLVIPFSISGNDVALNPYIYQVYQSPADINAATVEQFLDRFLHHHPVFIDCNDTTSTKGAFTSALRKEMERRGIQYNITNLKSGDAAFAKAFSKTQPNVVVLNTARAPELSVAIAKLDDMAATTPGVVTTLFGYTEWFLYTKQQQENFHRYDTYVPSTFYRDPQLSRTWHIESKYRQWFGKDMMYALPRFAITGFDQAYFFLKGLHEKGRSFNATRAESDYKPIQTPFNFKRAAQGGGMRNRELMFVHYTYNHSVVKIEF